MWDFSICHVLVIIDHRTRRLVHIGMTRNPTLDWAKQQVRDACPWEGPKFIIHDNDGICGQFGRGQKFRCAALLHGSVSRDATMNPSPSMARYSVPLPVTHPLQALPKREVEHGPQRQRRHDGDI
jgi:hypothetical protein